MKVSILVVLVAALVSAGGLVILAGPVAAQGSTSTNTVSGNSASVSIKGFAYNPGNITVVLGVNSTVVWTNDDSVTHTVVALDGSFNATVPAHSAFTHTFTTAGVYNYHCTIHTFMKGAVIVLAGPSTTTTSNTSSTTLSPPPTSSNTSSTTSTGAVPEFPFEAFGVVVITSLVLASYLVLRQTKRG